LYTKMKTDLFQVFQFHFSQFQNTFKVIQEQANEENNLIIFVESE
jgi:hypothetical protein